jgi:hypothetical protein
MRTTRHSSTLRPAGMLDDYVKVPSVALARAILTNTNTNNDDEDAIKDQEKTTIAKPGPSLKSRASLRYGSSIIALNVGTGLDMQTFTIHRDLLSNGSQYFAGKLSTLKKSTTLDLSDLDPIAFEAVYEWLYAGTFEAGDDFVDIHDLCIDVFWLHVLLTARKVGLRGLTDYIVDVKFTNPITSILYYKNLPTDDFIAELFSDRIEDEDDSTVEGAIDRAPIRDVQEATVKYIADFLYDRPHMSWVVFAEDFGPLMERAPRFMARVMEYIPRHRAKRQKDDDAESCISDNESEYGKLSANSCTDAHDIAGVSDSDATETQDEDEDDRSTVRSWTDAAPKYVRRNKSWNKGYRGRRHGYRRTPASSVCDTASEADTNTDLDVGIHGEDHSEDESVVVSRPRRGDGTVRAGRRALGNISRRRI